MSAVASAYAQVLSLGLVWTSVHCAGMCGPLLVSLDVAGVRAGRGPLRGVGQILCYQAGRGLTYAWLGGLCGALGAGMTRGFAAAGTVMAGGLGFVTLLFALRRMMTTLTTTQKSQVPLIALRRSKDERGWGALAVDRLVAILAARLPTLRAGRSGLHAVALGVVLGLMPCMVALWVLGLAALTGSALHGAALMLLLIVLTTPMLLGVTLLPRVIPGRRRGGLTALAPALLQALSGAWLLLIAAAGAGLISHRHLGFSLFGRGLVMMFY